MKKQLLPELHLNNMHKINCYGWTSDGCCLEIPSSDGKTIYFFDCGNNLNINKMFKKRDFSNNKIVYYKSHEDKDHWNEKNYKKMKTAAVFEEHWKDGIEMEHSSNLMAQREGSFCHSVEIDGKKIFWLTDCGSKALEKLKNYDLSTFDFLFIECNWDYFEITNHESGFRKAQCMCGTRHLSNLACYKFICDSNFNHNGRVLLLHASDSHMTSKGYCMFAGLPQKFQTSRINSSLICGDDYWIVIDIIK